MVMSAGFEPAPFRTSEFMIRTLSWRLRPLGQNTMWMSGIRLFFPQPQRHGPPATGDQRCQQRYHRSLASR